MKKTAGSAGERKTVGEENLNLRREIVRDIRDADNIVARVLRARFKKGGDPFDSLKVFPPQWVN
jgi:hypothetical protein